MQAQLVLNEASGKNDAVITNTEGIYADWIEVHNAGSTPLNMSAYFLSDDPTIPLKWQLPNATIQPGEFSLFFSQEDLSNPFYFNFGVAQGGETLVLSNGFGVTVSTLVMPPLQVDHSYGTFQEGNDRFFFQTPTPGSSNITTAFKGYADQPVFSPDPRFFTSGLNVSASGSAGQSVHFSYTGKAPDQTFPMFLGPVYINSSRSFMARAFGDSLLPSEVVRASYIVPPADSQLPVFALQVDPDSMFDPILGMHQPGPNASPDFPFWGANFWEERELAVQVDYFTSSGANTISQQAGIQIHGGRASRTHAQKPLRLTARSRFGDKDFDETFFTERPDVDEFKRVVLRNSGSDFCQTNIRDGIWHQLALHNDLNVDVFAFQPALVYINSQYWGILNIRERIDDDHLETVYGADKDSVLILEEENWIIQGDSMSFFNLEQFVYSEDLSDPVNWQHIADQLDIPSMIDYFALEMMAGNPDWPSNNLKYWKPSETQGKWRYCFFDLDATLSAFGWHPLGVDPFDYLFNVKSGWKHTELFRKLHDNSEFQRNFINRFADLINTSFSTDTMLNELDLIIDELGQDIDQHWGHWCWDPDAWNVMSTDVLPEFMIERPQIVRDHIENWYDLDEQHRIKFEVFPPGAGTIQVNTIQPPLPFRGTYFEGNPIDITVIPAPGQVFERWQYGDEQETALSWQWNPDGSKIITAFFESELGVFNVFPNPANDQVFVSIDSPRATDGNLQLVDASGRIMAESDRAMQEGLNKFEFNTSSFSGGVYYVRYTDELTTRSSRIVIQ